MKDRDEQDWDATVTWLEDRLGSPLSERVTSNLREDAPDFFSGEEEERQMLLEEVRRMVHAVEGLPAPTGAARTGRGEERAGPTEIEVSLSDYTIRRSEVFTEVATALSGQRQDVRTIRGRLPSYPMSEEQAEAYLEKHGAQRDRLDRIAGTLSRLYGWRERDAVWFVLTGEKPSYLPVRTTYTFAESSRPQVPNTARVAIEADVWVDAKEVESAFRTAQRQIKGGDNRHIPERTLTLVAFVSRYMRGRGAGSRREWWQECWRKWNTEYPSWHYTKQHGFKQVFDRFIHPKYHRPRFKQRDSS